MRSIHRRGAPRGANLGASAVGKENGMSKDNNAQGLTNSPAITSKARSRKGVSASHAQAPAPAKIVTPELDGHSAEDDLKVRAKGISEGHAASGSDSEGPSASATPAASSRTVLVTPQLGRQTRISGLMANQKHSRTGAIRGTAVIIEKRELHVLPFSPHAGLVTPLLPGSALGRSANSGNRRRALNGNGSFASIGDGSMKMSMDSGKNGRISFVLPPLPHLAIGRGPNGIGARKGGDR